MTKDEIATKAAESVTAKLTYGTAGSAVIFGLSANELAAIGGLILGTLTLVVNIYFKYRMYKIEKAKYEAERKNAKTD